MRNTTCALATILLVTSMSRWPHALEVPADIARDLKKIGAIARSVCHAQLLSASDALKIDISSMRDAAVSGHRRVARSSSVEHGTKVHVVDILQRGERPEFPWPVRTHIPGGAGTQGSRSRIAGASCLLQPASVAGPLKNGMVGVTMQRHAGESWDDGGRDVSTMIQWLQANIAEYRGNPDRMFIWAHSAGNVPLGTLRRASRIARREGSRCERCDFHVGAVQRRAARGGPVSGWRPAGWTGCWRIQSAGWQRQFLRIKRSHLGRGCGSGARSWTTRRTNIRSGRSWRTGPAVWRPSRSRHAVETVESRGAETNQRQNHVRDSGPRPGHQRTDERLQSGRARRALQDGWSERQGRYRALPGNAVRQGREPYVGGLRDSIRTTKSCRDQSSRGSRASSSGPAEIAEDGSNAEPAKHAE